MRHELPWNVKKNIVMKIDTKTEAPPFFEMTPLFLSSAGFSPTVLSNPDSPRSEGWCCR